MAARRTRAEEVRTRLITLHPHEARLRTGIGIGTGIAHDGEVEAEGEVADEEAVVVTSDLVSAPSARLIVKQRLMDSIPGYSSSFL